MPSRRPDCPAWCTAEHAGVAVHGAGSALEHSSRSSSLDAELDAVTAGVSLLAFGHDADDLPAQALVSLRLCQYDVADKDSIELTPTEARHLASLLVDAAGAAEWHGSLSGSSEGRPRTVDSVDGEAVAVGTPRWRA